MVGLGEPEQSPVRRLIYLAVCDHPVVDYAESVAVSGTRGRLTHQERAVWFALQF